MKTKFTSLKEITEAIAAKSKIIDLVIEQAGPENDYGKVKCLGEGDTTAKLAELKKVTDELYDLNSDYRDLNLISKARQAKDEAAGFKGKFPKEDLDKNTVQKSLGVLFKEANIVKNGKAVDLDIDLKTLVRTGAGWAPESMRLPRTELYPLRILRVADMFPMYATGQSDVKYMEETTHTNNAAEIAEETNAAAPTAYGEAAIVMTERSVPIEKLAVWIPVTEEQMEDVEGIEDFINNRLIYMVRNRLDGQLVAGDGNTPNLRGVNNASNVQSQALGTDTKLDAVFKAHTKVRGVTAGTGFGEPSANLVHPNDWQDIRLTRTADGIYILGNPTELGAVPLWGVPTVVTSAATENTLTTGDFSNYAALFVKRGISVELSNSHGSLFTAGVLAIKATMRCAAVYFRGSVFCKVTGI